MPKLPTVADLDVLVDAVFGAALGAHGFARVGPRRWVRSRDAPIRALFRIVALRVGYCPAWGLSSGFAPAFRGGRFKRQSTDRNADMDLVMDPVDLSGVVPDEAYPFFSGFDQELPVRAVEACASHFVPLALADLDTVRTQDDFCRLFEARSRLHYQRFTFNMYGQHRLVRALMLLREGQREAGHLALVDACRRLRGDPADPVLLEHVRRAEAHGGL